MYERWSTLHIEAGRRSDFWQMAMAQAFVSMTPSLGRLPDFQATMVRRGIDLLSLNEVHGPAHTVSRTTADLGRHSADVFFINLATAGRSQLRQLGHDLIAAPGELMVFDSRTQFELALPDQVDLLSLAVPHALLGRSGGDGRSALPQRLAARAPAVLLASQMRALSQYEGDLDANEASHIADLLVGLVSAVVVKEGEGTREVLQERRRLRGGLRGLIEQHYAEPGFTAVTAARQLGIPVRTLHDRLARDGTRFGDELMHHRLERAHSLLRAGAHREVAEIATRCGFVSAAHFSRRFSARYGYPPSALRRSD